MLAVAFLRMLRPDGPWAVTAIWPEREAKKPTPTKTYSDAAVCAKAIDRANTTGWNVYYSLNPTRGPITKKAKKTDIARVEYLHVDIDVPAAPMGSTPEQCAEHVAREKANILRRLVDDRPPSMRSGGW